MRRNVPKLQQGMHHLPRSGSDATSTYSWLSGSRPVSFLSTSDADIGLYDLIIRGTLDDTSQYPGDATYAEASFQVYVYTVVTAAQSDLIYIIGDTVDISSAISAFSYDPVAIGTYAFTYSISTPWTSSTLKHR